MTAAAAKRTSKTGEPRDDDRVLLLRDILIKSRTIMSRTKCCSRVLWRARVATSAIREQLAEDRGMRRIECAGSSRTTTTTIGRWKSRSRRGDRARGGGGERRTGRCRRQVHVHAHNNNNNTRNSRTRTRTHALVRRVSDFRSQSTVVSRRPCAYTVRIALRVHPRTFFVFIQFER